MIELLTAQSWWIYRTCTCHGVLTKKFKHPDKPNGEIWIKPNKNVWEYVINKRKFDSGIGVETLTAKLTTI